MYCPSFKQQENDTLWGGSTTGFAYTGIKGGWAELHRTAHLSGAIPAGGNVVMLDSHVEWRKFYRMFPRTSGGVPVFWW